MALVFLLIVLLSGFLGPAFAITLSGSGGGRPSVECPDTAGNHLNFTTAGGWTCGSSSSGGVPGNAKADGVTKGIAAFTATHFSDNGSGIIDLLTTQTGLMFDNSNTINARDDRFTLQDDAAPTKQARFQLSGITAGLTRLFTFPDYNATLATLAGTETLTGKTMSGASNTFSAIPETALAFTDVTTGNVSTTAHGFTPKLPGNTTTFLRGDGTYAVPPGAGGGAPTDAPYWTSTANATLSAETNLGALTTGLLKHTVSAGTSTPATAVAGTDYVVPGGNVATATALAANGTNCSAGQAAAGVDAAGNAEDCFTPAGGGATAVTAASAFVLGNLVQAAGNDRTTVDSGIVATTVATKTGAQTLTATRLQPRQLAQADGPTLAINADTYDTVDITALTQPLTISAPSGTPTPGQRLDITIYGAAAQALTWITSSNGFSEEAGRSLPTTSIGGQYLTIHTRWNAGSSRWAVQNVSQLRLKPCVLTSTANLTPIDGNCPGGLFSMPTLTEATTFQNPSGTFTDMQHIEIRIISATPQPLTWVAQFSANGTIALPLTTTGGSYEDRFAFSRNVAAGTWVIIASTQGSLASRTGKCSLRFDTGGFTLSDSDLTGILWMCAIPESAVVDEIDLQAVTTGTPSINIHKRSGTTNTALTTSALTTGAAGALVCAKTSATVGRRGITCSNILQNTTLGGGDITIGSTSGVAASSTLIVATVYYIRN